MTSIAVEPITPDVGAVINGIDMVVVGKVKVVVGTGEAVVRTGVVGVGKV